MHTYRSTYIHTYIPTYSHAYIHPCMHTYTHTASYRMLMVAYDTCAHVDIMEQIDDVCIYVPSYCRLACTRSLTT